MPAQGARRERDSLGEVEIPAERLYGASTARALENFPISGLRFPRRFLEALGNIKLAAAKVNESLGLLDAARSKAIQRAALEVARGEHDDEFVVDVFQTGSGTSTNMNANEVIANLAAIALGHRPGDRDEVHPNDHVNLGQSSNDVFPAAIHVAATVGLREDLLPACGELEVALSEKSRQFADVLKTGRTHLQDAVPITLGQEFDGYRAQIAKCIERLEGTLGRLAELPIGGTAVGTGLNTHREFGRRVAAELSSLTGHEFREAENHFEAQAAKDTCVEVSGALRVLVIALHKIADDIRWLGSGPRAGLGELILPALQPGSSIMPGKVNPVIPEAVIQVAAQVIGNDTAITLGGLGGHFELNLMMPLIAHNLLQSITISSAACRVFAAKCVRDLEANAEQCKRSIERNLSLATSLAPELGYDTASEVVHEAFRTDRTIREVVEEKGLLPRARLEELLAARKLARPHESGE